MPLSIATRIEPELMRAVRLAVLPTLDVGAESDLWFADQVVSRAAGSITFRPEVLPGLREILGRLLRESDPADPIHDLGAIVAHTHQHLSPVLLIEERVTWLSMLGSPPEQLEAALAPSLRALADEGRAGIAEWFAGAWERLPPPARRTPTAWQLAMAARQQDNSVRLTLQTHPEHVTGQDVARIVHILNDVPLRIRREGETLVLGNLSGDGTAAILVPDTDPRFVEVTGEGVPRSWVQVPDGTTERMNIGSGPVRLRTPRGLIYELPPAERPRPSTAATVNPFRIPHSGNDAVPPLNPWQFPDHLPLYVDIGRSNRAFTDFQGAVGDPARLMNEGILTLVAGPGGTGKTSLINRCAHWLSEVTRDGGMGCTIVDLHTKLPPNMSIAHRMQMAGELLIRDVERLGLLDDADRMAASNLRGGLAEVTARLSDVLDRHVLIVLLGTTELDQEVSSYLAATEPKMALFAETSVPDISLHRPLRSDQTFVDLQLGPLRHGDGRNFVLNRTSRAAESDPRRFPALDPNAADELITRRQEAGNSMSIAGLQRTLYGLYEEFTQQGGTAQKVGFDDIVDYIVRHVRLP